MDDTEALKGSWWDHPIEHDGRTLTPTEYLRENWQKATDFEMAEALSTLTGRGVTKNSTRQKRQVMGLRKTRSGYPLIIERSRHVRYNDPPLLEVDDLLVMADVHAPFHDAEWCSNLIGLAVGWGIETVLLAGDFLDFHSLNGFTAPFKGDVEPLASIDEEMDAATQFCDVLLNAFERVVVIIGNHEQRLTRQMAVSLRVKFLRYLLGYRLEQKIEFYPHHYCKVWSEISGKWRITHPRNASVIPGRVACRIAEKHECNVIAAHGHDWGEMTAANGRYAAACGGCFDPTRLDYVNLVDNTRPLIQQGAWILRQGQPYLLHPKYRPTEAVV